MGAVLVIVVGVDGESRAMAVDGGKGRTAVRVEAEVGITLVIAGATRRRCPPVLWKVAEMVWLATTSVKV